MKLALVVDSAAGLTKAEVAARQWYLLPLIFTLNGQEYADGVDLSVSEFYQTIHVEATMRTSATPPALILDTYAALAARYDHVIVFGLSRALSSQTSNLATFARDFPNVHVVASASVGPFIVTALEQVPAWVKAGLSINAILAHLNALSARQYGVLIPQTMAWLVKGGRISKPVARLARLFNIVPMISFVNGALVRHGHHKHFLETIDQAALNVVAACDPAAPISIYHGAHLDIAAIQQRVAALINRPVTVYYLPPVIAVHTGPGAIVIVGTRRAD